MLCFRRPAVRRRKLPFNRIFRRLLLWDWVTADPVTLEMEFQTPWLPRIPGVGSLAVRESAAGDKSFLRRSQHYVQSD